MVELIDID